MSISASEGSASETPPEIAVLEAMVDRLLAADEIRVSPAVLTRLVSAVVRLYAAASEQAGYELPPVTPAISTTEAVRLSVALARSQGLSPFDLALWFSQVSPAPGAHGPAIQE